MKRVVEVVIIPQRCRGCPYCEEAFPELFKVNRVVKLPNGEHKILRPLEDLPKIQKAVENCPARGISYRLLII
ncbi:hypothetical protein Pogu_1810 [Pyrobaculum oguniense TE7]|uniref:Ferredoxin n=1 Tax=Pyrobaculum oguniense (strain DSM 13380 / JCM 10595 / TE7) TaxID=698757 RepID=H6Q9G9_PYROT|nr:hypothetical protein Pogu_1810 [Pyrobaculum oguniense TE7]